MIACSMLRATHNGLKVVFVVIVLTFLYRTVRSWYPRAAVVKVCMCTVDFGLSCGM